MQRVLHALFILGCSLISASAASLSGTYSYFPVRGLTMLQIERELRTQGPLLGSTGQRHPGATNMEFTVQVEYAETDGRCRVGDAHATVEAKIILPRWRDRSRASRDVRLIWDTLARDIKRHEESHLVIAKNHARVLEDRLKSLPWRRDCDRLGREVEQVKAEILAKHDAAQDEFDRVESINFESRFLRLLRYRLEQIEAGRIKP